MKGATLKASASNGTTQVSCSTAGLSCALVGLTNGSSYDVVATVSDAANNVLSTLSGVVTPFTVPGAPTLTTVTPQDARIVVSWLAPSSNGGSPITGYQASASSGAGTFTCASTTTSCVIGGLTNGTVYTVSVDALNAAGHSASSAVQVATPFTVSGPPTGASASLTSTDQLVVTWTPPGSDGGSAVTAYVVRYSSDGGTTWITLPASAGTRRTIDGLANTASYVCDVAAVNAAGVGPFSAPSSPSVPASASVRKSTVVAAPGHVPADGRATSVVTVSLKDTSGRPVAGKKVTLHRSPSGVTYSGVTDNRGRAQFKVSSRHPGIVSFSAFDVTDRTGILPVVRVTFIAPATTTTARSPTTSAPTTTTPAPTTTTAARSTTTVGGIATTTLPPGHALGPSPLVHIDVAGEPGLPVGAYRFTVRGQGFRPGSTLTVTVHTTPTTLDVVRVSQSGSFRVVVGLPRRLDAGVHWLEVAALLAGGHHFVKAYPFTVLSGNIVGALGSVPPGALAKYVQLVPRDHRSAILNATGGLLVVLAAVAAGLSGVARAGRPGGRPGALEDVELERLVDEGDPDRVGGRWRRTTRRLDRFSRRSPPRLAALSPVLGRVVSDGDYLRAMLGLGWLVLCAGSVGLGIYAAARAGWYAVPPSLGLFLGILALGVLDATLGYLAGVAFLASVAAAGHLSVPGLREAFGLILVWFAVPLAAGALATLRRVPTRSLDSLFLRTSDVALGGLFGAWVAFKMTAALPVLAGAALPIGRDASVVAWAALGFVGARVVLETVVALRWPRRLAVVTHEGELESGKLQIAVSLAVQVALFLFISAGALGSTWALYAGAAVFFTPLAAWLFVERIPKSRLLTRYQPRGLVKWSLVIASTLGLATLFEHSGLSNSLAEALGFVILPVPVLVSWTLELFEEPGGEGERGSAVPEPSLRLDSGGVASRDSRWRWRAGGTVLLAATVFLVVSQGLGR
ncbi:MAG: fibronectin type III domain-containing protein [Acidimicrobiales bacterium]